MLADVWYRFLSLECLQASWRRQRPMHGWLKCQRENGVCEAGLLWANPWQWGLFPSSIPTLWDRRSACFRVYLWEDVLTSSLGINLGWLSWVHANLLSLVKYWLTMNTDSVLTDGTDNRDFWTALTGLLTIEHASGLEWAAWLTPLALGLRVINDSAVLPPLLQISWMGLMIVFAS